MVGRRLTPTESRELPITENPILTDRFIVFYRSDKDWPVMFYFFKELFLFLLIPFL